MKKHLLIALILLAAAFSACNKPVDDGCPAGPGNCFPATDCNGVMCTEVFASVGLQVRDAAGAPVVLDAFVVTDAAGSALPMNNGQAVYGSGNHADGNYAVVTDAWVRGHENSNMAVQAKGYIKGTEVFNVPFTIAADCCHVYKLAGQDFVTITHQQ